MTDTLTLYLFGDIDLTDADAAVIYDAIDYAWLADDDAADEFMTFHGHAAFVAPEATDRAVRWDNRNPTHLLYERADESIGCVVCDLGTEQFTPRHKGRGRA